MFEIENSPTKVQNFGGLNRLFYGLKLFELSSTVWIIINCLIHQLFDLWTVWIIINCLIHQLFEFSSTVWSINCLTYELFALSSTVWSINCLIHQLFDLSTVWSINCLDYHQLFDLSIVWSIWEKCKKSVNWCLRTKQNFVFWPISQKTAKNLTFLLQI